jgi:hypothetical protein
LLRQRKFVLAKWIFLSMQRLFFSVKGKKLSIKWNKRLGKESLFVDAVISVCRYSDFRLSIKDLKPRWKIWIEVENSELAIYWKVFLGEENVGSVKNIVFSVKEFEFSVKIFEFSVQRIVFSVREFLFSVQRFFLLGAEIWILD